MSNVYEIGNILYNIKQLVGLLSHPLKHTEHITFVPTTYYLRTIYALPYFILYLHPIRFSQPSSRKFQILINSLPSQSSKYGH